jgi:hypothetical protein
MALLLPAHLFGSSLKNMPLTGPATDSRLSGCMMASKQTTEELKRLLQKTINPRLLGLVGVLVCALISYALTQAVQARDLVEQNQVRAAAVALVGVSLSSRENVGHYQRDSHQPVAGSESGNGETTIVPKINPSQQRLSADGTTVPVITISLDKVRGNQRSGYTPSEVIQFRLAPASASFKPDTVKIQPGKLVSEPATLTASQATTIDVTCTPTREYEGLEITQPQPVRIEFFAPIDSVGIEPASGISPVNTTTPFWVYLYNSSDPKKKKLSPLGLVSVQLKSESGNGTLPERPVELTNQNPSTLVGYVGSRMGLDTIMAVANYKSNPIKGKSERLIVFPWLTFMAGLIGTLVGSLLRYASRPATRQLFLLVFLR